MSDIVKVIYRTWKGKDGDTIALFPNMAGTGQAHTCGSYMIIGQHGSASYTYVIEATRPATPKEAREMFSALLNEGYTADELVEVMRGSKADREERTT